MITRRTVLLLGLASGARASFRSSGDLEQSSTSIQSVTGEVAADRLGLTLMHEHVLVDFIGADKVSAGRYDADEAFETRSPASRTGAARSDAQTLVECTPAYLGRDPGLVEAPVRGVRREHPHQYGLLRSGEGQASARARAHRDRRAVWRQRWTHEAERGIDGTSLSSRRS